MLRTRAALLVITAAVGLLPSLVASPAGATHLNCPDFTYQEDAQDYYALHTRLRDHTVSDLDADHDGIACEDSPHRPRPPIGHLDAVRRGVGTVDLAGWALDPDTTASIPVHVYAGPVGRAFTADGQRPDLAGFGAGTAHGFTLTVPVTDAGTGSLPVCAYAIDLVNGPGNTLLGCATVSNTPTGAWDVALRQPGGLRVTGWATDPDTASPIAVHAWLDGTRPVAGLTADRPRPDVAAAFPGQGAGHGFDGVIGVPAGGHTVCLYAINNSGTPNVAFACRPVAVSTLPFGNVDAVGSAPGGVTVAGWAVDPDTAEPIPVHVYVDGAFAAAVLAEGPRTDVGAVFGGYGDRHGYTADIPVATPGPHTICVYAINDGPEGNPPVGCRTLP